MSIVFVASTHNGCSIYMAILSQSEPNQPAISCAHVLSFAPAPLQKNDPFCVPVVCKCLTSGSRGHFCVYIFWYTVDTKSFVQAWVFLSDLAEVGHKPLMLMPLFPIQTNGVLMQLADKRKWVQREQTCLPICALFFHVKWLNDTKNSRPFRCWWKRKETWE